MIKVPFDLDDAEKDIYIKVHLSGVKVWFKRD